tara:strand:+ start:860 stop:1075 length:216 start_codon:yes stop_codon:yes gene_type:complete
MINPSQKLYTHIKQLTNEIRKGNGSTQSKNDGLMKKQSPYSVGNLQTKGMEENVKIANIIMMLEDERNGRT